MVCEEQHQVTFKTINTRHVIERCKQQIPPELEGNLQSFIPPQLLPLNSIFSSTFKLNIVHLKRLISFIFTDCISSCDCFWGFTETQRCHFNLVDKHVYVFVVVYFLNVVYK